MNAVPRLPSRRPLAQPPFFIGDRNTKNTSQDWCSEEGATHLARKIEAAWAKIGKTVVCQVVDSDVRPQKTAARSERYFVVRSNMIAGMPPVDEIAA